MTLVRCTVRDNEAGNFGMLHEDGLGLYVNGDSIVIAGTCSLTENEVGAGNGGGINAGSSVTLRGAYRRVRAHLILRH